MGSGGDEELIVRFDQHQVMLLDRLVEDPEIAGATREEVVLGAFRAYVDGRSGQAAEAS